MSDNAKLGKTDAIKTVSKLIKEEFCVCGGDKVCGSCIRGFSYKKACECNNIDNCTPGAITYKKGFLEQLSLSANDIKSNANTMQTTSPEDVFKMGKRQVKRLFIEKSKQAEFLTLQDLINSIKSDIGVITPNIHGALQEYWDIGIEKGINDILTQNQEFNKINVESDSVGVEMNRMDSL